MPSGARPNDRRARQTLLSCLLLLWGCAGERADGRPWIRDIRLEGVKSVSGKELLRVLAVQKTSWLRLRKRYLDPFVVNVDKERIEAFYHARGYFDARAVSAEVVPWRGPPEAPRAVDVHFIIDEGLPTHITEVAVNGLGEQPFSHKLELLVHQKLRVGDRFDHQDYLEAKHTLHDELYQLGYAWAEVDGRVEIDRPIRAAKISLNAQPGPLVRFGEVRVEGAERIAERQIVLHSGIGKDARFAPAQLDSARDQLFGLGVFAAVHIDYEAHANDPTVADVIVRVREGSFSELRLGVGIGLDFYRNDIHGTLSFVRRNWLGGLRTLTLRLEPAWVAVASFWDPQRTGPALLADAQLIQPDWPLPLGKLELALGYDLGVEYAYQFHGPRVSVGLQRGWWRERVRIAVAYHFQLLQFFATDPAILDDPALAGRVFGYTNPYRLGWLEQNFELDLRDRPLESHVGVYLTSTFEEGGTYAGGAFQYEKIVPELRAYAPLGRRVTLAGRFLFGQLFSQGNLGSPITRRFYLGGPSTQRGFNYDRLSPQVPSGQMGVAPIPIGGDQMVLLSAELRVNVVRLFGQWLVLAAFVDGGDVGGPGCGGSASCASVSVRSSVNWGNLHWAAGGGLHVRTIVGSIRADVGVRLNRLAVFEPDGTPNPDPGQRVAFHLSLGEAF
jgi:translocation and assembly module TamA